MAMVVCTVAFSNFSIYAFKCGKSTASYDEPVALDSLTIMYLQRYWDLNILLIRSLRTQHINSNTVNFKNTLKYFLVLYRISFTTLPNFYQSHALNSVNDLTKELLQFLETTKDDILSGETRQHRKVMHSVMISCGESDDKSSSLGTSSHSAAMSDDIDDFMDADEAENRMNGNDEQDAELT